MARTCLCCGHPRRAEIDAALVAGEPLRDIARRVAVSKDAVARHRAHIPADLSRAQDAAEAARADTLLEQVQGLQGRAVAILGRAERAGDLRAACQAVREARACLELLGKLAGELQDGVTVNVVASSEWARVRVVVVEALGPYPEARAAVARALLGAGDAGA